ncbi:uncharacterized protein CLUP02_10471 [Colletotrichum lupini]|uniref:Uncharacterized protein n=1 Tax=Colletotrichum lupini TaxID=145971 RepID=A0A9Q8SWZ1_9PEZI|nr:uncharacterized protein CLUP02_10471 [Colletotrichum lupini]UQC84975.1 hypothetical protein CLUP02_10471 [Colletotrichum lupini]
MQCDWLANLLSSRATDFILGAATAGTEGIIPFTKPDSRSPLNVKLLGPFRQINTMRPTPVLLGMLLSGTAISTPSPTGATPCEPMSDIESSTSGPYSQQSADLFLRRCFSASRPASFFEEGLLEDWLLKEI